MDDFIEDALQKDLISFEKKPRSYNLRMVLYNTKNMEEMSDIDLDIYWINYMDLHYDHAGFTNDEEES